MTDDEARDSRGRRKEMKVKAPIEHQQQLHGMKGLTGKQISTAVTEAIELRFEQQDGVPGEGDGDTG